MGSPAVCRRSLPSVWSKWLPLVTSWPHGILDHRPTPQLEAATLAHLSFCRGGHGSSEPLSKVSKGMQEILTKGGCRRRQHEPEVRWLLARRCVQRAIRIYIFCLRRTDYKMNGLLVEIEQAIIGTIAYLFLKGFPIHQLLHSLPRPN